MNNSFGTSLWTVLLVINLLAHLGNEAEIDSSQTKLQHHSIQYCIFHYVPEVEFKRKRKQRLMAEVGCSL